MPDVTCHCSLFNLIIFDMGCMLIGEHFHGTLWDIYREIIYIITLKPNESTAAGCANHKS
jgi:hypothetical protein